MSNKLLPGLPHLPGWPAVVRTSLAARYLDTTEANFRRWAAEAGIRPCDLGCRGPRWRLREIDTALEGDKPFTADAPDDVVAQQQAALASIVSHAARRAPARNPRRPEKKPPRKS